MVIHEGTTILVPKTMFFAPLMRHESIRAFVRESIGAKPSMSTTVDRIPIIPRSQVSLEWLSSLLRVIIQHPPDGHHFVHDGIRRFPIHVRCTLVHSMQRCVNWP